MSEILLTLYPWAKAFHIMAVIAWMAGLFYLPRLYVYHAERGDRSRDISETLKVMEAKLLTVIMRPAMFASWFFGVLLLLTPGVVDWSAAWMWIKLVLVILMTAYHMFLARWRRIFAEDRNDRSGRYFRLWNEAPTLLMVGIVLAIVVRPF